MARLAAFTFRAQPVIFLNGCSEQLSEQQKTRCFGIGFYLLAAAISGWLR